jgi:hypothetical protein
MVRLLRKRLLTNLPWLTTFLLLPIFLDPTFPATAAGGGTKDC